MPARKTEIQFEKVWRYHPHTLRNQKADYWTTIAFKLKISLKWRNPQVIFSVVAPDCRVSPMRFLLRASTYAADSSSLTDLLSTDLCLQSCVSARERSASAHHHPGGGENMLCLFLCGIFFVMWYFFWCVSWKTTTHRTWSYAVWQWQLHIRAKYL